MPLQNRVTPYGEIVALPGRGTLMGNRGVLHDEHKHLVRQTQLRRWTELFFLDEAAALSAGHRPCAECRNADAYTERHMRPGYAPGVNLAKSDPPH